MVAGDLNSFTDTNVDLLYYSERLLLNLGRFCSASLWTYLINMNIEEEHMDPSSG